MTSATMTESLVDAKDEARQAEVRVDVERVAREIERSIYKAVAGALTVGLTAVGIATAVILSRL